VEPDHPIPSSGFAQFADEGARGNFLELLAQQYPKLAEKAHLAETRPNIIFKGLAPEEMTSLFAALDQRGKFFSDIQFRPMG
jgi:hypothetical protein